jgi:xanthine/uracil/vitamin C permease (AzgA family)
MVVANGIGLFINCVGLNEVRVIAALPMDIHHVDKINSLPTLIMF